MTAHVRGCFDSAAFRARLDQRRTELGISWREVNRQSGLPAAAGAIKLRYGYVPNIETVCRLMAWLGETDLGPYLAEVARE